MTRKAPSTPPQDRMIMVRPQGEIRAALADAVAKDPQGRSMSDIMRDAFWEWHGRQPWVRPAPARRSAP